MKLKRIRFIQATAALLCLSGLLIAVGCAIISAISGHPTTWPSTVSDLVTACGMGMFATGGGMAVIFIPNRRDVRAVKEGKGSDTGK